MNGGAKSGETAAAGSANGRPARPRQARSASPGSARRRAERRGRRAETLCVLALRLKGYRILGRRVRTPAGEIDILARRGRILAVIEVKARTSERAAREAVSPAQRRRLQRAGEAILAGERRRGNDGLSLRFDVMTVIPGRWPRQICDAWRP